MHARRMPPGAHVWPFSSAAPHSPRHASRTKNGRMVSPPRKSPHADAVLHTRFLPKRSLCVTFWANMALSTQKADARCHHSRFICPQAGNSFARLSQDSSPKRLNTVVVDSPSGASKGRKSVEHRKRAIPETAKHAIPGHGCPSMQCPSEWLPKLRSRHGLNSNSASFAETP